MNILYIDDDQRDIELFLLKARHIEPSVEIATANNSAEALERTRANEFDCIVADFRLDNEDGLQLLTELRAQGVVSPIVFFTGMGNETIAAEAMRRGASDYFVKDFESEYMQSFFQRMHQLCNGAPDPVGQLEAGEILYDTPDLVITIDQSGRFLAANGAARQFFNLGDEIAQRTLFELLPEKEAERLREYLDTCLKEHGPAGLHEISLKKSDNVSVDLEINASAVRQKEAVVGCCLIARDVTERNTALEAESEHMKSWRIFSQATQEGLVIHDDGIVVNANDSFARIVGVPPGEIIGRNAKEFVIPEHRHLLEKNIRENSNEPYVVNAHREDGTPITVELQGSSVTNDGRRYRVVAVRDLTRQRKVEQDLREKTEKLEAFNSMVSHDLRTPLWRIDTYADMIDAAIEKKDYKTVRQSVGKMRESVAKTADLISDLLTYSRIKKEDLTRETINLSLLAREAIAAINDLYPNKKADIEIDDGITAQGDIGMLRIVLENLFNNARKYSSRKSKPKIHFGVDLKGSEAIYFVKDNGIGFPPEEHDEIFLPFRRLHSDSEYSGTGVGLATVKRIVEMHSGRIWAESTAGEGATFYFTLG